MIVFQVALVRREHVPAAAHLAAAGEAPPDDPGAPNYIYIYTYIDLSLSLSIYIYIYSFFILYNFL